MLTKINGDVSIKEGVNYGGIMKSAQ